MPRRKRATGVRTHDYKHWRPDTPPSERTKRKAIKTYERHKAITSSLNPNNGKRYSHQEALEMLVWQTDYTSNYLYILIKLGSELSERGEMREIQKVMHIRNAQGQGRLF